MMKKLFLFLMLLALGGGSFDLLAEESRLELRLFAVSDQYAVVFDRHIQGSDTFYYTGSDLGVRLSGERYSLSYLSGNGRLTDTSTDTPADATTDVAADLRYAGECNFSMAALERNWYTDKPQARSQWTFALGAGMMKLDCVNRNLTNEDRFNFTASSPMLTLSVDYIFSGSFFFGLQFSGGAGKNKVDYQGSKRKELYKSALLTRIGLVAGLVF